MNLNTRFYTILVVLTDLIGINLAFVLFFLFRAKSGLFQLFLMPEFLVTMIALYIYWFMILTFVGMYRSWFASSRFDELTTVFKATFIGIFILFSLIFLDDYIHNVDSHSRILIFIYWGILLFFVGSGRIAIRSVQRRLLIKGFGRKKALIVGFNSKANEVHDQLLVHRALGLDVVAYAAIYKDNIGKSYHGIAVVDEIKNIKSIISEYDIHEIIIAMDKEQHEFLVELIAECENANVGLKIVPDLYEILSGQARTTQIYGMPLIDIMPQLMPEWEKRLKRVLDIIVSIIILVFTSPILLLTALAIKLESKGGIFFKQERCGLNGTTFKMIKFRSMFADAEKKTGPIWSTKNDPRITKVGRLIRTIRIDEVPQMVNVLKGEMSLVGPRPERPFFVDKFSREIPYYKRRLKVRPGITGWAQVKHKYDESIEDVKIKLRYDLFYIENMSLRMDFKILFRTIFVVLFGKGHYN